LKKIDSRFTTQWGAVNTGNTASAGLGIASAFMLFVAPPVGIGLGIGSAATGTAAAAGDSVADSSHFAEMRRQIARDDMSAYIVADILQDWVRASQTRTSSGATASSSSRAQPARDQGRPQPQGGGGYGLDKDVGDAVDNGLAAGGVGAGTAMTAARWSASAAPAATAAAVVATQVFGVAGALVATGTAIRGWTSSKFGQTAVRAKVADLNERIQQIQLLLAGLDRLECSLCDAEVRLGVDVRFCADLSHCFHSGCLQLWEMRPDGKGCCPRCQGPLDNCHGLLGGSQLTSVGSVKTSSK